MNVKELIEKLRAFPGDAPVRVGIAWPDRVTETHESLWVGDAGDGPQINAAMDLRGLNVFVGCTLQRQVKDRRQETIDLGQYETAEVAAKVRDFYIFHKGLDEPLNFPDFDYESWIPPRTRSGEYNPHVADILEKKLLSD
jgi:hypothetical protein